MSKFRPAIPAALAVLTMMAAPLLGGAQSAAPGPARTDGPVMYGADGGEYTPQGFALRGRAEVLQGDNRLRAEAINGFTSGGDLERVEASGDVYFVTPAQTIRGDRAVYTLGNGQVVVTGDVILTQGQNVLTGGRLVYDVRTQAARMEGAPRGAAGTRIQGVFYPQGTN
jgi:lipopolysaccharide export system protein LptA